MEIIRGIPPILSPKTYVSLDTEWANIKTETLHRPTSGEFACMTLCIDGEHVYYITEKEQVIQAINNIKEAIWIIHMSKFDLTHLGRFVPKEIIYHTRILDTLMLEKELFSGYYNRFGLNHLARRHLGVYLEKELQKSFDSPNLSDEQIEYACKDALYLRKIWDVQKTYITRDDLYVYKQIDLPCMFAVMDFRGFCIDVDGWRKLAQDNRQKQKELDEALATMIPFTPRQFVKLGEWLRTHGFPRLESTQEGELEKFAKKYPDTEAGKATKLILDSRMYGKRASTYGESWIDNYIEQEPDGSYSITCNYNIIGTETFRFSADAPPMQTIPTRETKEYREQFIPRKNHVLIVGDYVQQEVGIEAYITQDKKLIEYFHSGKDVYILTAKDVFGKDITKKDPLRKLAKDLVLGLDYGLSKYGLARKANITLDEAEEHIRNYLRKFPGVNEYQLKQRKITSYVKSILGHRVWLNPYSNQCENNALNAPTQTSAAEMLKLSINDMHKHWSFPFPFGLVGAFHDELVMDVPKEYAKPAQEFMKESMESMANWLCPKLKFQADTKICDLNWSQKDISE